MTWFFVGPISSMAVGQQSVGIIVVKNLRLKLQVLELLDVQLDLMSYIEILPTKESSK